jgi:hypothetical protein
MKSPYHGHVRTEVRNATAYLQRTAAQPVRTARVTSVRADGSISVTAIPLALPAKHPATSSKDRAPRFGDLSKALGGPRAFGPGSWLACVGH